MISGADCEDFNVKLPAKIFHHGGSESRIHIRGYMSRWAIISKVSSFKHIYNMWNFSGAQERVTIKFVTSHNITKMKE